MSFPVLIIANPISGRGRGARLVPRAEKRLVELGHAVEVAFTSKRGDAKAFAGRARDFGCVLAVGGDGTVNEVLNGLPDNSPPLAQIPVGTANVLAKSLKLPTSARGAAEAIHAAHSVPVDLGTANGRRFILMASVGFDAQVVYDFHKARKGTIRMYQYLTAGLASIRDYRTPRLTVTADGVRLPEASFVIVSNLPGYGGPLAFSADASHNDGLLDVLSFSGEGRWGVVRLFGEAFAGDPPTMPGVTAIKAKSIRIEGDKSIPWQVDGDPGMKLPLEIGVVPRAIRVIVGAG